MIHLCPDSLLNASNSVKFESRYSAKREDSLATHSFSQGFHLVELNFGMVRHNHLCSLSLTHLSVSNRIVILDMKCYFDSSAQIAGERQVKRDVSQRLSHPASLLDAVFI